MSDNELFQALKEVVQSRYQERHPGSLVPIRDWKGQEIVDFQEDLMETVQGRISEKWFYTHIKAVQNNKLPRIDMLNLLARYAGHDNWKAYVQDCREKEAEQEGRQVAVPEVSKSDIAGRESSPSIVSGPKVRKWLAVAGILVAVFGLAAVFASKSGGARKVTFCFVDADSGEPIPDEGLKLQLLREGESPIRIEGASQGCLSVESEGETMRIVVEAPYYKPDTVMRRMDQAMDREVIPLKVDDYALMIHIFSNSSLNDWQRRREQLDGMIAENAEIFQLAPGELTGMEMYNKRDFINKMTMPVKSLRNIEIVETVYDAEGKIRGMRFVQKEKKTP